MFHFNIFPYVFNHFWQPDVSKQHRHARGERLSERYNCKNNWRENVHSHKCKWNVCVRLRNCTGRSENKYRLLILWRGKGCARHFPIIALVDLQLIVTDTQSHGTFEKFAMITLILCILNQQAVRRGSKIISIVSILHLEVITRTKQSHQISITTHFSWRLFTKLKANTISHSSSYEISISLREQTAPLNGEIFMRKCTSLITAFDFMFFFQSMTNRNLASIDTHSTP